MFLIPVDLAGGKCSFLCWMEMLRCRSRRKLLLKPEMSDEDLNYREHHESDEQI